MQTTQWKLSYFRHIVRRKNGNYLEKEPIKGTIPGTRTRGRPRKNFLISNILY